MVADTEPHALDLELAGGEPDVTPLVCLVTVEEPTGHPGTLSIEMALPGAVDTRQRRPFACWFEGHRDPLPRDEIVLGTGLDDQTAMGDGALVFLRGSRDR